MKLYSIARPTAQASAFLAYLRGIETSMGIAAAAAAAFLAYLRGIETALEHWEVEGILKFLAYLRGIETWCNCDLVCSTVGF